MTNLPNYATCSPNLSIPNESASAQCTNTHIDLKVYETSSTCSGTFNSYNLEFTKACLPLPTPVFIP